MTGKGRIPIKAAERLAEQYDCPMVVIYALHPGYEHFTVTTYGQTKKLCRHAADVGNKIAEAIFDRTIEPALVEPVHLPDEPAEWNSR